MLNSTFRRSVVSATTGGPRRGGGGGGRGNYFDRYKLPNDRDTAFVLIEAQYVDQFPDPGTPVELDEAGRPLQVKNAFYKYKNHKRRLFENGKEIYPSERCSAGSDPHNPQPCLGCMAMDQGDKSVGVSNQYAFGIVHLAPYHSHPILDWQSGKVRMKQDNSGPLVGYDECRGRDCNYCRILEGKQTVQYGKYPFPNYNPKDIGMVFGRRRYIELGKNHLEDLMGWSGMISKFCQGIRTDAQGIRTYCKAELVIESWNCHVCGNVAIDMSTDPRTDEQIAQVVSRPYPCMHCRRETFLEEKLCCELCGNAQVASLFNRVLIGSRKGEQKNSHLVLSDHQSFENFEASVKQYLNGKPLRQLIEELGKPYEFAELLKPRGLEDQAKELKLQLPQQSAYQFAQAPAGYSLQSAMAQAPTFAPGMQPGPVQVGGPAPVVPQFTPGGQPQFTNYPTAPGQAAPQVPAFVPPTKPNYGA